MPSAWINHIKKVRAKNPSLSYKDAMKLASKSWKKKPKPKPKKKKKKGKGFSLTTKRRFKDATSELGKVFKAGLKARVAEKAAAKIPSGFLRKLLVRK